MIANCSESFRDECNNHKIVTCQLEKNIFHKNNFTKILYQDQSILLLLHHRIHQSLLHLEKQDYEVEKQEAEQAGAGAEVEEVEEVGLEPKGLRRMHIPFRRLLKQVK